MARFQTAQFGEVEYEEQAVVHFPQGLPAFENDTRFLLIERSETAPVVFLQSLDRDGLVFLAVPACWIDPGFRVELQPDERQVLGIDAGDPQEGKDLISLAILTVREDAAVTANLLAPIVIGAQSRRALQVIQTDSSYLVDQPLGRPAAACS